MKSCLLKVIFIYNSFVFKRAVCFRKRRVCAVLSLGSHLVVTVGLENKNDFVKDMKRLGFKLKVNRINSMCCASFFNI